MKPRLTDDSEETTDNYTKDTRPTEMKTYLIHRTITEVTTLTADTIDELAEEAQDIARDEGHEWQRIAVNAGAIELSPEN